MGPSMIVDGDRDRSDRGRRRNRTASMGPSMIVDGDELMRIEVIVLARASMGPSMIVDGDGRTRGSAGGPWVRFNGAVDDRRRRRRASDHAGADDAHASMGPSMIVDGDPRTRR